METPKRPTSVTVIAWIFIVMAGFSIFSGGVGFLVFSATKHMGQAIPPIPQEMPGSFKALSVVFQHFGLLALCQIGFSIFLLIAGIQFLKLRSWARTALEVTSWLGLVYTVSFGIFWVYIWIGMTSRLPSGETTPMGSPAMFTRFGAVIGTVVMVTFTVPVVVIIKFLRGATIKTAVTRSKVQNAS